MASAELAGAIPGAATIGTAADPGVPPDQPASAAFHRGFYRPEHTDATYHGVLDRARRQMGVGESVGAIGGPALTSCSDFLGKPCRWRPSSPLPSMRPLEVFVARKVGMPGLEALGIAVA